MGMHTHTYTQTNTYQAILITDRNSQSYAIFIYECDQILWNRARSASGTEEYFARIGLSDGNGSSYIHPLSGNASVDIDCLNSPESTVVNILLDLNMFRPVEEASISSSTMTSTLSTTIMGTSSSSVLITTATASYLSTETTSSMNYRIPQSPVSSINFQPTSTIQINPTATISASTPIGKTTLC